MEKKHIKYFQKQPELAAITFFKKLSWKTRALHLFSVTTTENIFLKFLKVCFRANLLSISATFVFDLEHPS